HPWLLHRTQPKSTFISLLAPEIPASRKSQRLHPHYPHHHRPSCYSTLLSQRGQPSPGQRRHQSHRPAHSTCLMLSLSSTHRFLLYSQPTDMRKRFDSLSGIIRNELKRDPLHGDVFVFLNKSRTHIKLLHWEL